MKDTKQEKREKTRKNRSKMVVAGRSLFTIARIKNEAAEKVYKGRKRKA